VRALPLRLPHVVLPGRAFASLLRLAKQERVRQHGLTAPGGGQLHEQYSQTLQTVSAMSARCGAPLRPMPPRSSRAVLALAVLAFLAVSLGSIAGCDREEPAPVPAAVQSSVEPTSGVPSAETSAATSENDAEHAARSGVPVRLRIPAIDVDAPVVPVGRDADGHMEAPDGPKNTGWYERRARPGERGSAVIAGHSGFRTGAAVFDHLDELDTGDLVYVKDEDGRTVAFVVRESRLYDWDASVPEVFRRDDGVYLNLITCTGGWNPVVGTSTKRIVVFCDMKEPRPSAGLLRRLAE